MWSLAGLLVNGVPDMPVGGAVKASYGVVLTLDGRPVRGPMPPPRFRHLSAAVKERDRLNVGAWFHHPGHTLKPADRRYRYRVYHFGNRELVD